MIHNSAERVKKAGGIFDIEKLKLVNAHYIKKYTTEKSCELSVDSMVKSGLMTEEQIRSDWDRYAHDGNCNDSLNTVNEVPEKVDFLFGDLKITQIKTLGNR